MKYALAMMLLACAALVGCGPTVTVQNSTGFVVRAVITTADGSQTVAPSPNESSSLDVSEGAYSVSVIPDAEWVEYAKTVRKLLNDQLANSSQLSGAQLLDVVQRLKDIAARMKQYGQAAGGSASCRGSVGNDGNGVAQVSLGADGKLVVACK